VFSAAAYGYPSILRQLLSKQKESNIKKMVIFSPGKKVMETIIQESLI
jgi:hypothetical protein